VIPPTPDPVWLAAATLAAAVIVLCPLFFAWARPPHPLAVLPSLFLLLVVGILRDATGGSGSGFAPLALLPIFWAALYGRRWQLFVVIAGAGLLFALPFLGFLGGEYGSRDLRYSVIWVAVSSLIGLTAQTLVSHQRDQRGRLVEKSDLLDSVLRAATEYSIIGTTVDGRITVYNDGARRMLGYAAEEMIGGTPDRIHLREEIEARAAELGIEPGFEVFVHEARGGEADTHDWTYVRADGSRFTVSLTVTAIMGANGEPEGFIGIATDVSASRAAEAALAESEYRFRTLVSHLPDAIIALYDGELRLQMAEGPMLARQGLEPAELLGRTPEEIFPPENAAALRGPLEAALAGEATKIEYESHRNEVVYEAEFIPYMRGGEVIGAYSVSRDITERKRFEEELRNLAERDPLTGLLNRRSFEREMREHIVHIGRYGEVGALVVFDVDEFKSVNDALGHAVGDELIVLAARELGAGLRSTDRFARLGGDEFAILLPEADASQAAAVAARLVETAREKCRIELPGGAARCCTISVGAVLFDREKHMQPDEPLIAADLAMYEAKRAGGDAFHLLSRPGQRRPRASERGAAAG